MDSNYTLFIEQKVKDFQNCDSYDDFEVGDFDSVGEFILDTSNFRPFHEGLTELLKRIGYSGNLENPDTKAEYLISQLKNIHSTIEPETVYAWFHGTHRPKVEPGSRNRMYELCFALNLSVEQVTWFFEHIYHDRSFNCHTITEAVYYYCFLHQLPYDTAKEAIKTVNAAPDPVKNNGPKLHTQFIRTQINTFMSIEELTTYLSNNKDAFSHWNVTALEDIQQWYQELIGPEETKPVVDRFKKTLSKLLSDGASYAKITEKCESMKNDISHCGLIIRNLYQDCLNSSIEEVEGVSEILSGKNTFKMAFVVNYFLATQKGLGKSREIPYIVKNNFPSKKVFSDVLNEDKSHTSQSYDAIRKTYILLKFFHFWYQIKLDIPGTEDYKAEELPKIFRDEIDSALYRCGYQPLFAGNPYDWIFLCSSYSHKPIEFFYEVIAIVNEVHNN